MKLIDEEKTRPEAGDGSQEENEAAECEKRIEAYKKEAHRRSYPNWSDLLAIVGITIGASLVAGVIVAVAGFFMAADPTETLGSVSGSTVLNAASYALQLVAAIICVVLFQRTRGIKKNFIKFNFKKFDPVMILSGVVLVFAAGVVIEPVTMLFPARYLDLVNQSIGLGGWAILTTVVLAPILEEILFRGLILDPVREKSGATRAVLISALLFGIIHIIPQQVVNAFVIGIILGFLYVRTGSLVNVIFIHAVNNGLAYVQMELFGDEAASTTLRSMIGSDTWYWIVYMLCVVLFGFALYFMMKSLKKTQALAVEESAESIPQHDNNSR